MFHFVRRLHMWNSIKLCVFVVCLCLLTESIVARSDSTVMDEENRDDSDYDPNDDRDANSSIPRKCKVSSNEAVQLLMDKVCLLCHDFFSHHNPDTRAQCRSNCFRSAHFKKCLGLFTPTRTLRHAIHRKHQILLEED